MYKQERLDSILQLIEAHGYVTVRYLCEELHYSTATINRDLNALAEMKKIRRSHGGAEPIRTRTVPLLFRYEKMKPMKKRLSQIAAAEIEDGDTVFIDGSTTTQYLAPAIVGKKDVTVVTNNMALASYLSDHGIAVRVLGGKVVEPPSMLDGEETVMNVMHIHADKCFFSAGSFTEDGKIGGTAMYFLMHEAMIRQSDKTYFVVDSEKKDAPYTHVICDFSAIHAVICDYSFPPETREKFADTRFLSPGDTDKSDSRSS